MQDPIAVPEAARLLKLSPSRVRLMASKGQLPAIKIGDRWVIERQAVEGRRQQNPPRGRRFTPRNAWAMLLLASGEEVPALDPVDQTRLKKALALQGLKRLGPRLGTRAEVSAYNAHPGEIPYVLEDEALLPSGISAAGSVEAGLLPGREADGYISQSQLQAFGAEHALSPADAAGNVRLRIVPGDVWVDLALGSREVAPPAAVALDLAEERDPRSRAAGRTALRDLQQTGRAALKARR
ncbi:MAG TPA: helix-turn-helix domain-containing protein [Solirubrobacterales bacterium]|nr:helix-turn-helix domain-containing protein [Solirubrobacterales bacterium]